MTTIERIRARFRMSERALAMQPGAGIGTAVTTARLHDGLTCEVEEGPWRLTVDLGEKHGGNGRGPNPGVLGRGALASCLAIGYRMWAARLDVPLDQIEVEIRADYDSRGTYGVGNVPAAYSEVRYIVRIESPATEREVMKVLDRAEQSSTFLEIFGKACRLHRTVELLAAGRKRDASPATAANPALRLG